MLKVTVGALITYKDELLMIFESQQGRETWDIPAGGVEEGESPDQAVKREVYEETGLQFSEQLKFRAIFYDQVDEIVTVHFLYEVKLRQKPKLATTAPDSSIKKIALRSRKQIIQMIADKDYEHELAKKRLENYLNDSNDSFVVSKLE